MNIAPKNTITLQTKYHRFAILGWSLISLSYLFRILLMDYPGFLSFVSGIMPNLAGAFSAPFILLNLYAKIIRNMNALKNIKVFLVQLLITFSAALVIEILQGRLIPGGFHSNDIFATILGLSCSSIVFFGVIKLVTE